MKEVVWTRIGKSFLLLTQSKKAFIGAVMLLIIFLVAIFAEQLMPYDPTIVDSTNLFQKPNSEHWFGTDQFGRDLFSRILAGSQISVGISLLVVLISLSIGMPMGLLAGFYGGRLDGIVVGITNTMLCFPWILSTLALSTIMGGGVKVILIALGVGFVPSLTRLVRSVTLSAKSREYVDAAIVAGESKCSIVVRYILPNAIAPVVIQATITMSKAVLEEAAISYLGYGVQPPKASWGLMLSDYSKFVWKAPRLCFIPGIAIIFLVLAINFFGDGLRDMLDPRYKGEVNKL
jgi:ABC-type dipeptide/oligopeptide/nickel transport system permease subunit